MGSTMKEAEGANRLQLGMLAMQKGNMKEAESYIRAAIRSGLPDKENRSCSLLTVIFYHD